MSGKLLLVIITACVLGGSIGGAVVIWVKDSPTVAQASQNTERPRAKSHYIKPGQVDRI